MALVMLPGVTPPVRTRLDILREGTSADRQLAIHQASGGDLRAVVEQVTAETLIGVPPPA
jgi:hypothetical protein